MTPHSKVVFVSPPPDCDVGGIWYVEGVDGEYLRLSQGCSRFSTRRENVRVATRTDVDADRDRRLARKGR